MSQPSKESILALRRFLQTPQSREILEHMRSDPPVAILDPAIHVYAHSAGVREGWQKAVAYFESLAVEAPANTIQQDRLG